MLSSAVFLGSKQLGLSVLKALYAQSPGLRWTIIHPDDTADARSNLDEFQNFARLCNLDIMVAGSPSSAREMLADLRPDIGFVCGWYWLLDARALALVPNGLWGIHNSLLPKYRGGAPLVWSIINGDREVGTTVFQISEGMDDGQILHQVRVPCGPDDSIGGVLATIEARLVDELPAKWHELVSGDARLQAQDESAATYCGQRTEYDGLVDWKWPAERVHNFIRAQSPPYPCAFSYLGPQAVRFVRAKVEPGTFFGTPGQVLMRRGAAVLISCGENTALQLLQASVGGVEQDACEFVRSVKGRFTDIPTM